MSNKTTEELKQTISEGDLTQQLLIDMVDSFYGENSFPLIELNVPYVPSAVIPSDPSNSVTFVNVLSQQITRINEIVYMDCLLSIQTGLATYSGFFDLNIPIQSDFSGANKVDGIFSIYNSFPSTGPVVTTSRIQSVEKSGTPYLEFDFRFPSYQVLDNFMIWSGSLSLSYIISP